MVSFDEEHLDTLERLKKIVSESSGIVVNGDIIIEDKGGNIKKDVQKIRNTPGMSSWKHKVKERDKVCQCCGGSDHLEVHHVNPLAIYPDLGTDINNGMVLCQTCHRDYHKEWQDSEGPATLTKFLREHGRYI